MKNCHFMSVFFPIIKKRGSASLTYCLHCLPYFTYIFYIHNVINNWQDWWSARVFFVEVTLFILFLICQSGLSENLGEPMDLAGSPEPLKFCKLYYLSLLIVFYIFSQSLFDIKVSKIHDFVKDRINLSYHKCVKYQNLHFQPSKSFLKEILNSLKPSLSIESDLSIGVHLKSSLWY